MKPLHVQVAEALGCKPKPSSQPDWACHCNGDLTHREHDFHPCHDGEGLGCDNKLAEYDTDWSATGPLIERFGITLLGITRNSRVVWRAAIRGYESIDEGFLWEDEEDGDTPLTAVCTLILALHAAGRLPTVGYLTRS